MLEQDFHLDIVDVLIEIPMYGKLRSGRVLQRIRISQIRHIPDPQVEG